MQRIVPVPGFQGNCIWLRCGTRAHLAYYLPGTLFRGGGLLAAIGKWKNRR